MYNSAGDRGIRKCKKVERDRGSGQSMYLKIAILKTILASVFFYPVRILRYDSLKSLKIAIIGYFHLRVENLAVV